MGRRAVDGRAPARPPLVLLLVAVSVTLVAVDQSAAGAPLTGSVRAGARRALAPAEAAGEALLTPVTGLIDATAGSAATRHENERLRSDLAAARAEVAGLEAVALEGRRLAGALAPTPSDGAGGPAAPTAAVARVVSLPGRRPGSTFLLDRGSEAGVTVGMPVTAYGALVGRVVEAVPGSSSVLPVSDAGFAAGIRLGSTGEIGIAHGGGSGASLRLELLDPRARPAPGDLVVTSGVRHGRFPPGIPVGRVDGGRVTPLAKLSRLEIVAVVAWSPR